MVLHTKQGRNYHLNPGEVFLGEGGEVNLSRATEKRRRRAVYVVRSPKAGGPPLSPSPPHPSIARLCTRQSTASAVRGRRGIYRGDQPPTVINHITAGDALW